MSEISRRLRLLLGLVALSALLVSCAGAASSSTSSTSQPPATTVEPDPDLLCDPNILEEFDGLPGPFFLCRPFEGMGPTLGGKVFEREGGSNVEDAMVAWMAGPTSDELAGGYVGGDLTAYPAVMSGVVIEREATTVFMDFEHWEPMNISTSAANQLFVATLLGTAFSDPTVDWFWVSITGTSCPVFIGEEEHCFPMTRAQFIDYLRLR